MNYQSEGEGERGVFRDIIVIGASSGGLPLLRKLAASFPADFGAAVFIAMHTAPGGPGLLADILAAGSKLPASFPMNGEPIQRGHIYVAPPDHHVLLDPLAIAVVRGPRENRFRPAIDPLFRSAAVNHGSRVIAVILSGMLDDGSAGLLAVKQCGGAAVVQNPAEADFPDMILNACAAVQPDHAVSVDGMPALFAQLMLKPVKLNAPRLGDIARSRAEMDHPANAFERALSIALRTLDDTAALAGRLSGESEKSGRMQSALIFRRRREEALENATVLRKVLAEQRSLRVLPDAGATAPQADAPAGRSAPKRERSP